MATRACDPRPPKKSLEEHNAIQTQFLDEQLKPILEAAQSGQGQVFFVDAAHFVFGTFLCCLRSFTRLFVRTAAVQCSGRVECRLAELISVTNTTVVNTETMCELMHRIVALKLTGPITLVLDGHSLPTQRGGHDTGGRTGHHSAVPAVVLAEPESDRAALEIHQTPFSIRSLPPDLRRFPGSHRTDAQRHPHNARQRPGNLNDTQLPAIRQCLTDDRVKYNAGKVCRVSTFLPQFCRVGSSTDGKGRKRRLDLFRVKFVFQRRNSTNFGSVSGKMALFFLACRRLRFVHYFVQ